MSSEDEKESIDELLEELEKVSRRPDRKERQKRLDEVFPDAKNPNEDDGEEDIFADPPQPQPQPPRSPSPEASDSDDASEVKAPLPPLQVQPPPQPLPQIQPQVPQIQPPSQPREENQEIALLKAQLANQRQRLQLQAMELKELAAYRKEDHKLGAQVASQTEEIKLMGTQMAELVQRQNELVRLNGQQLKDAADKLIQWASLDETSEASKNAAKELVNEIQSMHVNLVGMDKMISTLDKWRSGYIMLKSQYSRLDFHFKALQRLNQRLAVGKPPNVAQVSEVEQKLKDTQVELAVTRSNANRLIRERDVQIAMLKGQLSDVYDEKKILEGKAPAAPEVKQPGERKVGYRANRVDVDSKGVPEHIKELVGTLRKRLESKEREVWGFRALSAENELEIYKLQSERDLLDQKLAAVRDHPPVEPLPPLPADIPDDAKQRILKLDGDLKTALKEAQQLRAQLALAGERDADSVKGSPQYIALEQDYVDLLTKNRELNKNAEQLVAFLVDPQAPVPPGLAGVLEPDAKQLQERLVLRVMRADARLGWENAARFEQMADNLRIELKEAREELDQLHRLANDRIQRDDGPPSDDEPSDDDDDGRGDGQGPNEELKEEDARKIVKQVMKNLRYFMRDERAHSAAGGFLPKGFGRIFVPADQYPNPVRWYGFMDKMFAKLLERGAKVRNMLMWKETEDNPIKSLVDQMYRVGISIDEMHELLRLVDKRETGRQFKAQDVLGAWRRNLHLKNDLQEQAKVAMQSTLAVWSAMRRMAQEMAQHFNHMRHVLPLSNVPPFPPFKLDGNFRLTLENAIGWNGMGTDNRRLLLEQLGGLLEDSDFASTFNAQFRKWIQATGWLVDLVDPKDIRPDFKMDVKLNEAITEMYTQYNRALDRLGDRLEKLNDKHTDRVIDEMLQRCFNVTAERLWTLRERPNQEQWLVQTVDGLFQELLQQLTEGKQPVRLGLLTEQRRRQEQEVTLQNLKAELKRAKEDEKDCQRIRDKFRVFLRSMLQLAFKGVEGHEQDHQVVGEIFPPQGLDAKAADDPIAIASSEQLVMDWVRLYFGQLYGRFAVASKSLEALQAKLTDALLKNALDKFRRHASMNERGATADWDALMKIQARSSVIGMGTAAFTAPVANLELQVAGETRMAGWRLFTRRLRFGTVYGFARLVAGFANRNEEAVMVPLVPGVETGSTNFWLIMGRIEDELLMHSSDQQVEQLRHEMEEAHTEAKMLQLRLGDAKLTNEERVELQDKIQEHWRKHEEMERKLGYHGIRTNAGHRHTFDLQHIEEKIAHLLPEQREVMRQELRETRNIQLRVAIESLRRLNEALADEWEGSYGSANDPQPLWDSFMQEALTFYKPQMVAALLQTYQFLQFIPQVKQAHLLELITHEKVAPRFAALVANVIRSIELQTDKKSFDQKLYQMLTYEHRALVNQFENVLKRKARLEWDDSVSKRLCEE